METVSNQPMLRTAIEQASEDGDALQIVIPHAVAWYGFEKRGRYLLAPLKFAAFQGMEKSRRLEFAREEFDSRSAERTLNSLTVPVAEGHPEFERVRGALDSLSARLNRRPNARARMAIIPRQDDLAATPDHLVQLLSAVFLRLTPAQQQAFRKLIRSANE